MNILGLTCAELSSQMSFHYGKGLHHAKALYREVFRLGTASFGAAPEFSRSPALAARLTEDLQFPSCRIVAQQKDEVFKFASELPDRRIIETVAIPAAGRTTLCVSSQVGCRMGCRFCVTGAMGFVRNLQAEEIVWQVHAARFTLGLPVDNIVFMGMGEPLDNFDHVAQAIRVMSDQRGFDIAHSHITVSTAGHADGIRELAALHWPRLRLAVSLNAAYDSLRSRLMPINRRYPLARLREELQAIPLARDSVIFVEYVLLADINDSSRDANALIQYLQDLPVRVNVIAYNSGSSGTFSAPTLEQVQRFCGWLTDAGLFVRARRSRGQSIMAACGQLGTSLGDNVRLVDSFSERVPSSSF
jgi:23S rRNA (adenine2503-C2)-methyltransferase